MYQGKFDAKGRGQKAPKDNLQEILEARNAAKAAQKQPKVTRQPLPNRQGQAPQQPARQAPAARPVPAAKPAQSSAKQPAAKPVKKGPRLGSVIFYTLYFLMIFVFFAGMFFVLQWLNGWLGDYQAAQPTVKCQEVFDDLFQKPDWAELYKKAGIEDTQFEGVDQFAAYMEEKVGNKKLDFVETSAGLSGDKKYIVRMDGEKIATFTLEGGTKSLTDIPDWKEGKVELFFTRDLGYKIQKADGHKAFVNGQELSDDYTIQIVSTKVEKYLPAGTAGARICTQEINGLLRVPEVTVTDASGKEMEVVYDEESGTFAEQTIANFISDEEKELVLGALEARAEFMINASGARAKVSKYFDGASQVYSDIVAMAGELWMNADRGHHFEDETVTSYYRYTEDLFSARGSAKMVTTLKDGGTKNYDVEATLFFTKKNGKWVCYEMTNEDVSQPVGKVRLTFMSDFGAKGVTLSSEFYETKSAKLQTPTVSVPEGKVFSGWIRQGVDESGKTTWTVVFTPDESGVVTLSNGASLEPMTLYPLIENAVEASAPAAETTEATEAAEGGN